MWIANPEKRGSKENPEDIRRIGDFLQYYWSVLRLGRDSELSNYDWSVYSVYPVYLSQWPFSFGQGQKITWFAGMVLVLECQNCSRRK